MYLLFSFLLKTINNKIKFKKHKPGLSTMLESNQNVHNFYGLIIIEHFFINKYELLERFKFKI